LVEGDALEHGLLVAVVPNAVLLVWLT
jgi:hypothetical protein